MKIYRTEDGKILRAQVFVEDEERHEALAWIQRQEAGVILTIYTMRGGFRYISRGSCEYGPTEKVYTPQEDLRMMSKAHSCYRLHNDSIETAVLK